MSTFGWSIRSTTIPDYESRCLVSFGSTSPLTLCLLLLTAWCMAGLAGLVRPLSIVFVGRTLFPLGAVVGAALAVVAATRLAHPTAPLVLPIWVPELPL